MVPEMSLGFPVEGFTYAQPDARHCTECGACERVCPVLASRRKLAHGSSTPASSLTLPPKTAFACYNHNEAVRAASSSGGLFSRLAEWTLHQGGVVFGARFNADFTLHHVAIEHLDELPALRGSKYLQSDLGRSFSQALTFLKADRWVLFSGTPCQIAGLTRYLGRRTYERLLTVDVVCHGVPSPSVFARYLQESAPTPLHHINFRDKTSGGWKHSTLTFEAQSALETRSTPLTEEPYMRGFLQNLYVRPICHRCIVRRFESPAPGRGLSSGSDLTLGDYWGIRHHYPQMDDNGGTSLVLVHSERGRSALWAISADLTMQPTPLHTALQGNPALLRSAQAHRQRHHFFAAFASSPRATPSIPLNTLIEQFLRPTLLDILRRKTRGTWRKLTRRFSQQRFR